MEWMLAERDHHEQAEQECRDVLSIMTRVLAPTTLDTLTSRHETG
jgi:hypothetical protein